MPYDPPPPGPTGAGAAVSVYVWLCAGVGLVMSGCCVLNAVGLMFVHTTELMGQLPPDMPNREQVAQMVTVMGPILAIASVLLLLIPSLVVAVLGFKVRSGSRGGTLTALIILAVQGAVLALILLVSLMGLAITRSLAGLIVIVLIGGALLLIGVTIAKLWAALNPRDAGPPMTPWQ